MIFALDANIISFLLRKDRNPQIVARFKAEIEEFGNSYVIPPLSYYEVAWYLIRKKANAQLRAFNGLYEGSLAKLNMNESEFMKATEIRADLETRGLPLGNSDADIFIAAHCIIHGYTLVTDNLRDFRNIDGLNVVNWQAGKDRL